MKKAIYFFIFFLSSFGVHFIDLSGAEVALLGSLPVAQLSGLEILFPPSLMAETNLVFETLGKAALQISLNSGTVFFLSLLLYTFLILSVRLKKTWLSVAALSSFCLLAMSALAVEAPCPYVGIFLLLSFLLLIFDLSFFGGRGWMTWAALLPMSWSWWIWFCQAEISSSVETSLLTTLFLERGAWLFLAWLLSFVLTQIDIKILKNIVLARKNSLLGATRKSTKVAESSSLM